MKRPAWSSYLLGNGPIAFALMAGGVLGVYLWWAGHLGGWMTLGAVVAASWASRAREELTRYRAWSAQWTGASSAPAAAAAPSTRPRVGQIVGLLAATAGWFYLFHAAQSGSARQVLLGVAAGLIVVVPVLWLLRRRQRARSSSAATRRANQPWVLVAVVAPQTPVPSLQQAAQALPDYCYAIARPSPSTAPTRGSPSSR